MTAHFYCWEPSVDIDPTSPNFREQLIKAQNSKDTTSLRLLGFVSDLLAKYPDLTETDDTPWATGPLAGEITGKFMNFVASWSWFTDDLVEFVSSTARRHGLHCYDPQHHKHYKPE
ncbi:MAG: hypothetical protein JNL45_17845 [Hyphomicrobium sp.]|nr:hypothetical protein [Hyphomicrobium sp.]